MYQNLSKIEEQGFIGFKTVHQLWSDHSAIPNEKGIYLVITPDPAKNLFLNQGVGGFHKNRNPNIDLNRLGQRWVSDSLVLYIGQAGGNGSSSTLKKRLKQYLDFGKGKPVGHYGGRFIWQLANHPDLIIAWKNIEGKDTRDEEKRYIHEFESFYGVLPFSNINR
jgi:hypothetical protein